MKDHIQPMFYGYGVGLLAYVLTESLVGDITYVGIILGGIFMFFGLVGDKLVGLFK